MGSHAAEGTRPGSGRRPVLLALLAFPAAFVVSTLPGVRAGAGYDLVLDGWLNNLAAAVAPVICLLRMRSDRGRDRWAGRLLTFGLAAHAGGNVFWTVAIRTTDPPPFPSAADALSLAFYPLAFASLVLMRGQPDQRLPLSEWLDGLVGGLAVAALTSASRRMVVHYQPKIDSRTQQVRGVEALVRWQHPVRGLLYPDSFLPLLDEIGLMRELTHCVLDQALDQLVRWYATGRQLTVAVNLPASALVDLELPEVLAAMLARRGLPARCLELEITEEFLMADRDRARDILGRLRSQGIRIAVDDYGTGYSSLAYLKELPVDELKLDRSFLRDLHADPRAMAIVRSTIALAHSLGLNLVAEGVEDRVTSMQLAESGCDVEQGWFHSKALPSTELEQWLDRHQGLLLEQAPAVPRQGGPGTAAPVPPS